jgi:Rieske Fe-S protein
MSTAVLAAMAGVALRPGTAAAVPVAGGSGAEAGPGELTYPLPETDGVTIDRQQQVIVVRFQEEVYAFNLACPHENTALRWRKRDGRFQCPRHQSQYQPDGTFIKGRATRNMDRFAVRRSGDTLIVDVNHLFHSDEQTEEWSTAEVPL